MTRQEVKELHYITPIENIPSILQHGILCHRLAKKHIHRSVAMPEVQARRASKRLPQGGSLHDYANLYFHARNPMMYVRRNEHQSLCVLCINPAVLDLPDVMIADGNAASDYTAFHSSPDGLEKLDSSLVFAHYWTGSDRFDGWHRKRIRCAEVLVPDKVEVKYIVGGCVSCSESRTALTTAGFHLPVRVDASLFFQQVTIWVDL